MNKKEKKYKNYEDNMKKRRILKKQGFENIKIKNGKVISKARYEYPYAEKEEEPDWDEYQRNTRADAYEEDYRTFEYESWR